MPCATLDVRCKLAEGFRQGAGEGRHTHTWTPLLVKSSASHRLLGAHSMSSFGHILPVEELLCHRKAYQAGVLLLIYSHLTLTSSIQAD